MGNIFEESETFTPGNDSRNGYFPPVAATYRVALESAKHNDGSGPTGNKAFIFEFKILESSNPELEPGAFRDRYQSLSGTEFKGAAPKQKQELTTVLCALMGFDPDTSAGQAAFKAAHPNLNTLAKAVAAGDHNGREMILTTTVKKTKKGEDFTIHSWAPVSGQAAPAQAPTPPPPPAPAANPRAGWQVDPSGHYLLNPATNAWEAK